MAQQHVNSGLWLMGKNVIVLINQKLVNELDQLCNDYIH